MELHLMHFLIVCPLVFLAGFVDAVAGGGGLISLPAYMIAGLPVTSVVRRNHALAHTEALAQQQRKRRLSSTLSLQK